MNKNVAELDLFRANKKVQSTSRENQGQIVSIRPNVVVGAAQVVIMAGPCSVESEEHLISIAKQVGSVGAQVVRGAIFKPRTSPYTFQGLGKEGLSILKSVKQQLNVPIISEVMDPRQIEEMIDCVDLFQIGSRNMYNYPLLKELALVDRPVLLKRAFMATIEEFIGAAEYLLSRGNPNVILCERGIRSFDNSTRFCLDLNAIPVLKEKTRLPVVVDPSHGTGVARYVESMSLAAIAAGCDGLLVEVHHDPANALSDGNQSLTIEQFDSLMSSAKRVASAIGRSI